MVEPDAAGPPPDGKADSRPKRSRPLSIAEAARQMERQRAPLVAEIERAARERRWIDAEFGLEDPDAKASTAELSPATEPIQAPAASPEPERWKPPASTDLEIAAGWAPYERRDAPAWLVERIREWWRPFEPGVVEHWIRLEREIKNLRHELRADQRTHEEFHNARLTWSAEDLVDYMEGTRMIPKRDRPHPGRPRKRQADLDVHQWIAAQALADPSFRHLSQTEAEARGPVKARTIGTSPVWKEMKRVVAEEAEAAAERAREEFGSRVGEDEDNIGMRVGRKHGIGRQRATQADRDHHRAAEDLINEADAAKRKKHAQ
jgi:hypothetical protein